jgi:putative transposase
MRQISERYEPGRIRTAKGAFPAALCRARVTDLPFCSSLMSFFEGNSEVAERLVAEMYARGLSTGDLDDAFWEATGELLISRSAVSETTDSLWEDYRPSAPRTSLRSRLSTCSWTRSSSRFGPQG